MTLERLVRKGICLETMAAALYRCHLSAVDVPLQPLLWHFLCVEEKHRDDLRHVYKKLFHHPAPTFGLFAFVATCLGTLLNLLGERAILRGECILERQAVKDYTSFLKDLTHPEVKTVLHQILKDEKMHPSLTEMFQRFRQDEKDHIREMESLLQTKASP